MSNSKNEKNEVVGGVSYSYSTDWIDSLESEEYWRCYWRQQKLMANLVEPDNEVLEIGLGSGFTANYLRSKGVSVTTLDIDKDKKPDIIANIVRYDFNQRYDHVLAFQVFEHIPFNEFHSIILKLGEICNRYLFISLPRNEKVFLSLEMKLPKLGKKYLSIKKIKKKITENHHFWEVDDGIISKKQLENTFSSAGFSIKRFDKAFSRLYYALEPKS
ncbi:MAG: class I SAM-dependent methyltransferase [Desulfosalsimonas sp.]